MKDFLKRIKWMAILYAVAAMLLTGCGSGSEDKEEPQDKVEAGDEIQIGIAFDSFLIERWERDRDIFVSRARDLGAAVNVQNANGDVQKQKEQIKYLIDKDMDVIVVIAVDSFSLKKEIQEAEDAGIKVVAYDRLINDVPLDLYISFDNEMVGRFMADAIIDKLPSGGRVMKINGPTKDNNVLLVNKGFDDEIRGHGINIFDTYYADEWKGEEAFNYLSENPEKADRADAVMCGNDSLAGQAVKYYSEKRRAGSIPIVGQDADLDACQRVVEGTQTMTVYKSIDQLAQKAAESAVSLAKGNSVAGITQVENGSHEVPYLSIPPIMVTKDNIDSVIIDGGFHLREDVYLNAD
ncbi:MAG: substrate-binding domain-containing protein [Lachnospiraceae bacterium]|nr:substrate-binding domain-containing protein [Lachnospiraceae bacterium]MBR1523580.1 substrate-binding domain-containing protein [Lachnospiraceae bacterium]